MKPPFELGLLLRGTFLWPAEKIIVLDKGHAPDVQVFGTESSRPHAGYILLCAQRTLWALVGLSFKEVQGEDGIGGHPFSDLPKHQFLFLFSISFPSFQVLSFLPCCT